MKKLIHFLFLISFAFAQNISQKIDSLLSDDFFNYTNIGIKVINLSKKSVIYQKNNKLLFRPASNMKILTSAVALDFLGTNYNFNTTLSTDGTISNNIIQGNVILKSDFDPMLTEKDFDNLVKQLKEKDISQINGDLILDISNIDTLEWNRDWAWDDEPNYYAPHISSISLNGNCVDIIVKATSPGKKPAVFLSPEYQNLHIINNGITTDTSSKSNISITRNWYYRNNTIIINGNISLNDKQASETVNLEKPHLQILLLFYQKLLDNGIKLSGTLDIKRDFTISQNLTKLAIISHDIKTILKKFNKESDNLTGEMLLRLFAYKKFNTPGSSEKGSEVVKSYIAKLKLDPSKYQIIDGSGLAPTNYINNDLIITILENIYSNQEMFAIFYETLPIAGVDGTLSRRMKNSLAYNNVRAKTGTINGVSSLSGYVKNKNGDILAFSIFIQNHVSQLSKARFFQDEICKILASHEL